MTNARRKQIKNRLALLERASMLFGRYGALVPLAIAYLRGWPTHVELYPNTQIGESWKVFLSLFLYWLAALALERAVSFVQRSLEA
ncbi:hypothetical protein JQ596_06935 [Bradyrhizobium manausense]|uniref:hypothetical protein n=1 Tax=Bradyrhizobium TaxID=374 RepID=UPI001BA7B8AD|nr:MULTISPECIES: hypothetical protein [Bradyrhizobium]MBR0825264.1 hypothetical protein [Bradyrhizobium manausense]UVO28449.1 hypothetical protein KUF59_39345 [Bradyrhizobium arachidis]